MGMLVNVAVLACRVAGVSRLLLGGELNGLAMLRASCRGFTCLGCLEAYVDCCMGLAIRLCVWIDALLVRGGDTVDNCISVPALVLFVFNHVRMVAK